MTDYLKVILCSQFDAALAMLRDCIAKCPIEHWDSRIAHYPFWQVAYHTLSYFDFYLSPDEQSFQPREFHPVQIPGEPFNDEPVRSSGFNQADLLDYLAICRQKAVETLAAEDTESLERPSGFRRRNFSRGELHIYNLRHVQHHTGQLSASLRRIGVDTRWVGAGWPDQ